MALQFQDIAVPFTGTQSQQADDPLIQPPDLVNVQNGEFDDRDNVKVVDGISTRAISVMTGETAITDSNRVLRRLLTHKDELLLETWAGIYRQQVGGSFALAAASSNRKRDNLRTMRMGASALADAQGTQSEDWNQNRRPNAGVLGMDSAVLGDYTCLVWCEQYGTAVSNLQVSWQIRHKTSDALVGRGRIRDSGGTVKEPRVVAFGGQFRIYALGVGGALNLGYLFIDPASTQNVSDTLTALGVLGVAGPYDWFDVALSPTTVGISACAASGLGIDHAICNQATPTAIAFNVTAATPARCTPIGNMYVDTGGLGVNQAFIAFYSCVGTAGTVRWSGIRATGVAVAPGAQALTAPWAAARCAPFKSYTGAKTNVPVLIDGIDSTLAGVTLFFNQVQVLRYDATTGASGVMASGATATPIVDGAILAGQPVAVRGGSAAYDGTGLQSLLLPVQSAADGTTFVVLDVAQAMTTTLAGGASRNALPVLRVFDAGSFYTSHYQFITGAFAVGRIGTPCLTPDDNGLGVYIWCAKFTPNITNVTDLGQNPTNIQRNTLKYTDDIGFIEFAECTYLAGGCPLVYDGQDVFEEGFAVAPQPFAVTPAGAGGPLSAGTYNIVFVYEWFDGQGNRWQSAPSANFSFVAAAANTYTASVRACPFTLKSGVQIIPYRTTVGSTIYRRDSPLGVTPLTDAAIASSEPLYTGGVVNVTVGAQANNALPACKTFTVHQNRLFAIGGEFEQGFFYSKERSLRFPAEFNRASGFGRVPDTLGRLAAGTSLDDKLILAAEYSLAVMYGVGPNFFWAQNNYSTPVAIQASYGIRFDTPWMAPVSDGVWYVTTTGPRLLSRGLQIARNQQGLELGAGVMTTAKTEIQKCEAVIPHPTKPQVYLYSRAAPGTSGGQLFIYDYQRDKWSWRSDLRGVTDGALSLATTRSTVSFITGDTVANNPLAYIDAADTLDLNPLVLETGWVSLAGLQRFQRMTHIQILAIQREKGPVSDYTVQFELWTDYNLLTLQQSTTLTYDATYAGEVIPLEFQLVAQQSTAFKFRVTMTPLSKGGNFALVSWMARVGLKRGGAKLQAPQRG